MAKMTVIEVAALKARDKPYKQNVDTGLQLRIATNSVKTWSIQYVVNGKQREYKLPRPYGAKTDDGHISLIDARHEAARVRALARDGIDFQVQKEEIRATEIEKIAREQAENLTLNDLFSAWLNEGVTRKDGNAELIRTFKADVLPAIGKKHLRELTESDLRDVLKTMVGRGVNRSAVVMRDNLVQMFSWASKRQPFHKLLSEGNPAALLEIKKIVSPAYDFSNARDRILLPDEIIELRDIFDRSQSDFDNAPDRRSTAQPILKTTQIGVWIMLSTTCRVGEMLMARWEHVDLEKRIWFIPKANVKDNLADLTVHLSEFSSEQFKKLKEVTGDSDWCFPARLKDGHVCVKSISKQVGDRQSMFKKSNDGGPRKPMKGRKHDNTLVLADGKNGAWTPHDLRRTGATMMQSLGVSLDVIDRCQNHVLVGSKVRRHYLHYDYEVETREAWRLLGDRLFSIISL